MKAMGLKKRLTSHMQRVSSQGGIALVITLMIVTLITAMVVEFAYGVYVNTNALHNWQISQELSLTARSATRLASKLITAPVGFRDSLMRDLYTSPGLTLSQKIPFKDVEGTITLRIEDETAKFNLNALRYRNGTDNNNAYNVFVRLLEALNMNTDIANMVCFWMNSSTGHRPREAGSGRSKNTYLDSVDELLMIPGIDLESYRRLQPYVTIYGSGDGTLSINLNTADVPVLMSLSDNISKQLAERIISYRPLTSINAVPGFENPGSIPLGILVAYNSSVFHVAATAESGGIKRIVESVLQGGTVLYWKEM